MLYQHGYPMLSAKALASAASEKAPDPGTNGHSPLYHQLSGIVFVSHLLDGVTVGTDEPRSRSPRRALGEKGGVLCESRIGMNRACSCSKRSADVFS